MKKSVTIVKVEVRHDDPIIDGRRFYTVFDKSRKHRQMQGISINAERELDDDLSGYFEAKREAGHGCWTIGKRVWDHVWD